MESELSIDKRPQVSKILLEMNEQVVEMLEKEFDHWVVSPDESKVVAWRNMENNAKVFDTTTGLEIVTINAKMDRWYWAPGGKDLISHDYVTTCIWDATTGNFLRSVEAMYDRRFD